LSSVKQRGRKRRFDDPIRLLDGGRLVTLQDAGEYITKLPKSEHTAAEWQAAMEALIGCDIGRSNNVCARRRDAGAQSPRRARVRYIAQGSPLGKAQAGA
jgi:hypothetical protein